MPELAKIQKSKRKILKSIKFLLFNSYKHFCKNKLLKNKENKHFSFIKQKSKRKILKSNFFIQKCDIVKN